MVEEGAPKMARVSLPEEPPANWMRSFRTMMNEVVEAQLTPIASQVNTIAAEQNAVRTSVGALTRRVEALENRSTTGSTAASSSDADLMKIEIKGFCKRGELKQKGLTRMDAQRWMNEFRDAMPEELKQYVKDPTLFGSRSMRMTLTVPSNVAHEVLGCIKETLEEKSRNDAETDVWARFEPPMWKRVANSKMARLQGWCVHLAKNDQSAKFEIFWNPDFAIGYTSSKFEGAKFIVRLKGAQFEEIAWTRDMCELAGLPDFPSLEVGFRSYKPS
eukprot:TRINITY_DN100553_c0_g1_i1.p1 TRINITY_DN100553_c0_g1~~TRINITY_DN100553_c0_g1_i1.p1  ORF type:complete len:274 (+),score=67.62 TRINITY_DN100553_c0_g1_i1:136-957(+)